MLRKMHLLKHLAHLGNWENSIQLECKKMKKIKTNKITKIIYRTIFFNLQISLNKKTFQNY